MRQLGDGCDCHFFFFFPLTPSRSLPSWFHVSSIHCSTYLLRWVSSLFGKEQVGHKERHENTGSSSLRQTTRCFNPCSGHFWRAFTKHHQFAITLDILSYYRLSDTFFLLVSTSVYPPKKKKKRHAKLSLRNRPGIRCIGRYALNPQEPLAQTRTQERADR